MKQLITAILITIPLLFSSCDSPHSNSLIEVLRITPGSSDSIITMNFKQIPDFDLLNGHGFTKEIVPFKSTLSSFLSLINIIDLDLREDVEITVLTKFKGSQALLLNLTDPSKIILQKLRRDKIRFSQLVYKDSVIFNKKGTHFSISFINEDLIAIGELDAVKKIIHVSHDKSSSVIHKGKLKSYLKDLKSEETFSFVYAFPEEAKSKFDIGEVKLDLTRAEAILGHFDHKNEESSGQIELVSSNSLLLKTAIDKFIKKKGLSKDLDNRINLTATPNRLKLSLKETLSPYDPTGKELKRLKFIKGFIYGLYTLMDGAKVLTGKSMPMITFTIEDTPPSVYYNFVVPEEKANILASEIHLPSGFSLSKIPIIDGEIPKYYITANVYRVSASMTKEVRVEWSTYVDSGDGIPRYMVIEPRSASFSMDPVNIITSAGVIDHAVKEGQVKTYIESDGNTFFQASFNWPQPVPNIVVTDREWAIANDLIYWKNGVYDRTYYGGSMFDGKVVSVDPSKVSMVDTTKWSSFVKPIPENVLVYDGKIDLVLSPWVNLNEANLDNRNRLLLMLIKRVLYGAVTVKMGADVITNKAQPIIHFKVKKDPPSIFYNYRIPDENAPALEAMLQLPGGFTLAKTKILESDLEPHYYISLNVYEVQGLGGMLAGIRAEWSVYVHDGNGNAPRFMVIEATCDTMSMDPVDLLTMPGTVEHRVKDNVLTTMAEVSNGSFFQASFALPDKGSKVVGTREWIATNDLIYWRNGVCDRAYYGGDLLDLHMISIDLETVAIHDETPWAEFVDPYAPNNGLEHVLVFQNEVDFAIMPWWNLGEM